MMKSRVVILMAALIAVFIAACTPLPETPTVAPISTTRPTPTIKPTATSTPTPTPFADLTDTSSIGWVELEQYVLRGNPGDEWPDVLTLTTTGADGFVFPGYICPTEQNPYGIGHVTTSSGGIAPDTTRTYDIQIWDRSEPGQSCIGVVKVWLYQGDLKYVLSLPIMIIVE